MKASQNLPIAILSFNRPEYLTTTLSSLQTQTKPLGDRQIALFQDGSWSPSMNKHHCDPAMCRQCVDIFRQQFPNGNIFESDINLGSVFNYERAERYVFETFDTPAAIFLEDDLVLGRAYITVLERLIDLALADERIGYVAAFGNWKATRAQQLRNTRKLRPMHLLWAFGLTQRHWRKCRHYVERYLDLVRGSDYRQRDHQKIQALVQSWGIEPGDTGQDRIKAFATALVGCVMVNTEVAYGRYIGQKGGLNFTPALYEQWGLEKTEYFDEEVSLDFDLSTVNFDPWSPGNNVRRIPNPTSLQGTHTDEHPNVRGLTISRSPMPTEDDVVWCYRHILEREPESRSAVERHLALKDFRGLVLNFINSREFQKKRSVPPFVPLDRPALEVEVSASPSELTKLYERVRDAWTHLGTVRPYHSVLTRPEFLPKNLNDEAVQRFWASGTQESGRIRAILKNYGFTDTQSKTCVEYGCGLGRLTLPLASIFHRVDAYDISAIHLALAERQAAEANAGNIVFHLSFCDKGDLDIADCDVFYSCIVFQHNPPPIIKDLIVRSLKSLRPGGIAIFQVPTYTEGYSFGLQEYLKRPVNLDIEMHCIPQSVVFELISATQCRLLEVREDASIGGFGQRISNTFVAQRS
jgi:2-polyprenyl-3-methyl-5-hydroxy-6-metoxy-1,4-benzoquinol methylase